jgi:tetratricopeptide (TPR) repeat protein
MRIRSFYFAAVAAFAIAGCKSGGGGQGGGGDRDLADGPEPGQGSEPGTKPALAAAAEPVDQASLDFQAQVKAIESSSKSGAKDWGDVKDRMQTLINKHPRYGLAYYNLGVAHEKLGELQEAEQAYQKAIGMNANLRAAYENLAAIQARRGEHRQAESLLRDIAQRDSGASVARVALAGSVLARGDVDEAVRLAQEALSREPKNLDAYCILARAAVEQKDFQRARLIAAQGRKISQDAGCLHLALARVLMAEKQTAEALVEFEKAVTADPTLIEARFQIAEISLGFKDFRKAIANYDAVTKIDAKNSAAFVNMGVAFKGSARFQEAEQSYLRAIEVAGNEPVPEAHFNLGVLYLRNMNRLDDAKTQLKRYLQVANAGGDDPAFGMLEEIDQMRAMEEETKRQEAEMKRQQEIDEKAAADEAKRQAEEQKREEAINKKAGEKGASEPTEPQSPTPAVPQQPPPPPPPSKKKEKEKKGSEPVDPS